MNFPYLKQWKVINLTETWHLLQVLLVFARSWSVVSCWIPQEVACSFDFMFPHTELSFLSDSSSRVSQSKWFLLLYGSHCESVSHSVMSISLQPHGLQPTRLLCPWDSPGKNAGVGSHSFLQGIFPTGIFSTGIEPVSPALTGRFFTIWATRKAPYESQIIWKLR